MARPLADYRASFTKLVSEIGVGKPVQATVPELATLIDEPPGRLTRVMDVMKRADALKLDFTVTSKGRKPMYTVTDGDFESVESKMRERGIAWSQFQELNVPNSTPKPQNGHVTTPTHPDSPFSVLAPLRKSEPRAELEVARKYRDQQSFIAAKKAEFEAMGLVFDPAAIKIDFDDQRRQELNAIVRVLPYVESIEKQNTTLEEQNRAARAPIGELAALRGRVNSQKEQIERLVAEKGDIKDDVQRLMGDHRKEVQALKDQVSELQGQLRKIRGEQAVNGAIGRHEVNEAVARIGGDH